MKLNYQITNKGKNAEYGSYSITIPAKYIDKMKWKKGIELELEVTDKGILIKKF